ncbi:hypothetical protein MCELHM10_00864 [Paracoccaceae bacterium]
MQKILALFLLASPAFAQEAPAPQAEDDGFSLMEEGMLMVMRGMMTEMEPALDEMEQALTDMEPALQDLGPKFAALFALIDDIRNYDAPVILPNGDIWIHRNKPLFAPADPGPNGEIDL